KDILGEPVFSHPGKVTSETFDLTLSIPADAPEGTTIRYTLDGTEPTETSPLYTNPIHLSVTRTVRAKLFCDGYLSPRSTTHSYIHHPRELTLPVVSMVTNRDYFYGNKLGIYVQGNYTNHTPNYEYDWRRPINIEYFEAADTESSINQLCETRVKGGATRGSALKSLAVYANKRFGEKRFNYEFFPDQTPGIGEFKSFEMRNSGNDFDYMYMRDAVIQQCMGMNCDLDWQPSRPAILYINGEYKGILNIRPRSNEDNIYSYYDGLEDIDMVENWWELKDGSIDSFNAFQEFYAATDHTFAEYDAVMDTGEFCNLMIMGTFFDNKDFPGNNIVMWRPQAEGGRHMTML
ncbi:MAG: chitobiase/beta-hexosaminidase C-terminal domain-containing protein, partial [Muribaculaceae bacterium]|nr:chitobiase/beta-hexosaminidase C-terminal domain-containing protein [Muribaculaceae bacterium]